MSIKGTFILEHSHVPSPVKIDPQNGGFSET